MAFTEGIWILSNYAVFFPMMSSSCAFTLQFTLSTIYKKEGKVRSLISGIKESFPSNPSTSQCPLPSFQKVTCIADILPPNSTWDNCTIFYFIAPKSLNYFLIKKKSFNLPKYQIKSLNNCL